MPDIANKVLELIDLDNPKHENINKISKFTDYWLRIYKNKDYEGVESLEHKDIVYQIDDLYFALLEIGKSETDTQGGLIRPFSSKSYENQIIPRIKGLNSILLQYGSLETLKKIKTGLKEYESDFIYNDTFYKKQKSFSKNLDKKIHEKLLNPESNQTSDFFTSEDYKILAAGLGFAVGLTGYFLITSEPGHNLLNQVSTLINTVKNLPYGFYMQKANKVFQEAKQELLPLIQPFINH